MVVPQQEAVRVIRHGGQFVRREPENRGGRHGLSGQVENPAGQLVDGGGGVPVPVSDPGMGGAGVVDGAEYAEIQRERDAGEEREGREPELHGEDAVVQGEGEVAERAEAEARARPEEEDVAARNDGVEE